MYSKLKRVAVCTALTAVFASAPAGCAVAYSQKAYDRAVNTRHKTVLLLDKAQGKNSAKDHKDEMAALRADYKKAVEGEQAREGLFTKNTETINIWKSVSRIVNQQLQTWEKQGKLGVTFINRAKAQLHKAYEDLLDLEKAKAGAPKQ